MEYLVSIVVPVYNSATWLDQCVKSLLHQTYKKIEIILVDDESTDESGKICDYYSKQDDRVKVVHKENGGVSAARNKGLEVATGDWISFVDSDDYLSFDIIEQAIEIANMTDTDLICWNYVELLDDESIQGEPIYIDTIKKEEVISAIIAGYRNKFFLGKYIRAVWGKLFKSKIIKKNNISFNEKLYIGEDAVFLLSYMDVIKNLTVCNKHGYYYRILNNSAVRKYKKDLLEQNIWQYECISKIIGKMDKNCILDEAMQIFQWGCFRDIVFNSRLKNGTKQDLYLDAKKWYKYMRSNKISCSTSMHWGRTLYRIQCKIGTRMPMIFQYYFVIFGEYMRKSVAK